MKLIGTNLYKGKFNDVNNCRFNACSIVQRSDEVQFGAVPFVNKSAVIRRLNRLSSLENVVVKTTADDKAEKLIVCKYPDDVIAHIEKALGRINHLKYTDVKVRSEFIPIFFSKGNRARIGIQIVNHNGRKEEILNTFTILGKRKQSTLELLITKMVGEKRIMGTKAFWVLNKS